MRTKHLVPHNDDIDFISYLPDDVCSLIVSFLPTKEAVATSVLSRRWRYVYASSPSLDFDFSLFPRTRGRKQAFIDFVERTLELFSGEDLRRFHLSMDDYGGHEPLVEDWIGFAVAHNVQELDLGMARGKLSKIPDCMFQCGSLTSLKLRMRDYAFALPSPVGLKGLKSIEIKSVSLMKGVFFKEMFENCLLLEELVVQQCKIDAVEIDGNRLEKLTIYACDWVKPSRIKVSAPSLRCFNYIGAVADSHCFDNLPSLAEAVLNLSAKSVVNGSTDEQCSPLLMELVQMVGNAKVLTLSPWCIEQLSRAKNLPRCLQAQGENVRDLVLYLVRREDCVQMVAPLLVSCVKLQNLTVFILPSQSLRRSDSGQKQEKKLSIRGKMRHLKSVKLEYIDENKTGLELVKFLLKYARALEKMTIVPSKDGLEHAMFRRKVSMFQKASRIATVKYCISA